MFDENAEEFVLKIDDGQAKTKMRGFEQGMGKMFDKSAMKAAVFNQAIGLGIKAFSALMAEMKKGIDSAIKWEKTTKLLESALSGTGQEVKNNVAALNAYSAGIERKFGISDEEIRQLQTLALNYGVQADKVNETIQATMALSTVTGQDLTTSFNAMQQAMQGVVPRTIKNISAFQGLTAEELKNTDIVARLNDLYGSQLEDSADTAETSLKRMGAGWDSLTEAVAKAITTSQSFIDIAGATGDAMQAVATVTERGGIVSGLVSAVDIAFFGGASTNDLLDTYKRIDDLDKKIADTTEDLRVMMPGGGFDFGGKGGVAFDMPEEKKGKKKSPMFSMDEGFGGAFGAGGDAIYVEGVGFISQEEYTASQNLRYDLDSSYQEKLGEMQQGQVDYWVQLENKKTSYLEQQTRARERIEGSASQKSSQMVLQSTQAALGAINAFAQGGIIGALQYAASMATSYGMQSIASGTAHEALAASLAFIPGMQAAAAGLAVSAANEIAVGTALAAGGQIAGAGISLGKQVAGGGFKNFNLMTGAGGGSGGGKGSGGGGGGGYSPGVTEPASTFNNTHQGGGDIHIHLNGPVYDGPGAGVAIMEKIKEAKQQGF